MQIRTIQSRIGGESFWCDRLTRPAVIAQLEQYCAYKQYTLVIGLNFRIVCHSNAARRFVLSQLSSLPANVYLTHTSYAHDQFLSNVEARMMQGAIRVRRKKKSVRRLKAMHALHVLAEIYGYVVYETHHNYWLIRGDAAANIRVVKY